MLLSLYTLLTDPMGQCGASNVVLILEILHRWVRELMNLLDEGDTGKCSGLSQFSNIWMCKIELNHSNSIPLSLNEFIVRGRRLRLTKRRRTIYSTGVMGQTKKRLLNLLSVATWGYITCYTVITLQQKLYGGAQLQTIKDTTASIWQQNVSVKIQFELIK